ncbi:MAG: hypothetical protein HGA45_21845 [Chloroflexales bacterium]|nr:hypothetical protein [Chloroflexales bacterium]
MRLADGRVLVVGGTDSLLAEIYDPATGNWATTTAMGLTHFAPGAALLSDGRVLVVGGNYGEVGNEIYDPATDKWSLAAVNPGGPHGQKPMVAPLADGRMLVIGGNYWQPSKVELYNPQADDWTVVSLDEQINGMTAAPLSGGQFLIFGNNGANTIARIFNPASGALTRAARPPLSIGPCTITPLANGSLLFINIGYYGQGANPNASIYIYDPAHNRWMYARPPAPLRQAPTATLLDSGLVLLTGGYDPPENALASAELYDPAAAIFNKLVYLPSVHQSFPYEPRAAPNYTIVLPRGPTATP